MAYTVKQLSELAGISVRTIHYYDEIGLLEPSRVGENGYRFYEDPAVYRLQQILFFRELDLSLKEISFIIDKSGFDVLAALGVHRSALEAKIRRLHGLIDTIDSTLLHLTGEVEMSEKGLFTGFNEADEKRYQQEAREMWGDQEVDASYKRWNSYTMEQKEQIKAEGAAIYADLASEIERGAGPTSVEVQQVVARWHQHMRYFYEPSIERLQGLGQLYTDNADFAKNLGQFHPDLPQFMREAIEYYCQELRSKQQ